MSTQTHAGMSTTRCSCGHRCLPNVGERQYSARLPAAITRPIGSLSRRTLRSEDGGQAMRACFGLARGRPSRSRLARFAHPHGNVSKTEGYRWRNRRVAWPHILLREIRPTS